MSTPGRRRRAMLIGVPVLVLALWTMSRAGEALVVSRPSEPPEAIVSLASHEWERLPATVALAQRFPTSTVILTVPAAVTDANCYRCAERAQWLIARGIAADRIRELPDRGSTTYDEAVASRRYAEQHGIRRLAVVTSPYHTRRALATFRDVFDGLQVDLGIYPACGHSPARPATWWAHAYDRAYVAYEWTAALYYQIEFGVPIAGGQDSAPPSSSCASGGSSHT